MLKALTYFIRVAEMRNLSRAAESLGVAQPVLSKIIRQLETQYHLSLFLRTGRGVELTDAGWLLLDHARGILHQVTQTEQAMTMFRGQALGHVRVGLPPSLSRQWAVTLVEQFRQYFAQGQLSIIEGFSVELAQSLRTGRLDLALLYNPHSIKDLEVTPLLEAPLVVVGHPERSHPPQGFDGVSLAQQPLIMPSWPNAIRQLVSQHFATLGLNLPVSLEIDGVPAILDLVRRGLGFTVLTETAALLIKNDPLLTISSLHHPTIFSQLVMAQSAHRPLASIHHQTAEMLVGLVTGNTSIARA